MSAALRLPLSPSPPPSDGDTVVSDDQPCPPGESEPLALGELSSADAAREQVVDLRPLKGAARKLPENDPVRLLIEGEPDHLPRSVLAAKADSWVLLLLREG